MPVVMGRLRMVVVHIYMALQVEEGLRTCGGGVSD